MFSAHDGNKLEISNKKTARKSPNSWKLHNMILKKKKQKTHG